MCCVSQTMLRWCRCCRTTNATNPGRRDGGGKLDWRAHKCVLNAGGAICAAAVVTWACVLMCGDVLIVGSALRSRAARRFRMRSRLMVPVGRVVSLLLDALLMGILGNGIVMFININRAIRLLASLWGMGMFAVVCTFGTCCGCTLRTCCVGGVSVCVAMCSNLSGCALICTCVVSTFCCRSFVAGEWWVGDAFVFEVYGVRQAFVFGLFYIAIMCAMVFWWCEEIPPVHWMKCPSALIVGILMYLCIASHWGEWHFDVVKWVTKMRVCQHLWGGIRLSNEVDCEFCLW